MPNHCIKVNIVTPVFAIKSPFFTKLCKKKRWKNCHVENLIFKNCAWIILLYATFDQLNEQMFVAFSQLSAQPAQRLRWIIKFMEFSLAHDFPFVIFLFFKKIVGWIKIHRLLLLHVIVLYTTDNNSDKSLSYVWEQRTEFYLVSHEYGVLYGGGVLAMGALTHIKYMYENIFIRYNKHSRWLDRVGVCNSLWYSTLWNWLNKMRMPLNWMLRWWWHWGGMENQ